MNIYSTLHIGSFHSNHCEDALVIKEIGGGKWLIAVMDGCTMGDESVFASILLSKIIKNTARKYDYHYFITRDPIELKSGLKEILQELVAELKLIKNQLGMDTKELLSTLILGIVDENSHDAEFIVIGDGLICVDGKYSEYEQGDKPDYLGYHLSEQFDEWYDKQQQFLSVKAFRDLSVCTDGIYTFRNFRNDQEQKSEADIKAFLLQDLEGVRHEQFLDNKMLFLKEEWKHSPGDDVAIIRIVQ